jgi:hypothetical protein
MGCFPHSKEVLVVFKGSGRPSVFPPIVVRERALCAESSAAWQLEGGGHGCGCGEWPGSIYTQIRAKAEELDNLLLFAIRMLEAGRPEHRLQLLPPRARRIAIAFEVSKLLQELQEVTYEW